MESKPEFEIESFMSYAPIAVRGDRYITNTPPGTAA